MILREKKQLFVVLIGGFACVLIAATFLVPWYGIDYFRNGEFDYRSEYSLGFERASAYVDLSYLMAGLTFVLVLSLIASVNATILPLLGRTESGKIASVVSAELLLASVFIFYAGVIEAGHLDHFSGYTLLNRTVSVETAPMIGWWILVAAIVSQGAHVTALVCLNRKKREGV
ncbi:MAG TPA: hypothetical protein VMW71_02915 [Thermoplasmata archaeon]|nr:hypothetical protein [Thermoplasmata archaeon]